MSLYIGKDNSNNNVFHITASTRPVSDLKEGVQADTLFHSNAPLITCKKWDMVSISGSGNDYYVQFPLSAISYILSVTSRLVYDIVINGKIHRYLRWANVPDGRLWWYTAVSGAYSQFPTLNHTFIRIGNNNNAITSASIIVYNISIDGTIHNPIQNPSTVVISNTELSIGGTDITELNFLTSPKVNDTDYYFIDDYNNTRQILNSSSTSTGIIINTVPSIKISNGDKCIINASSGFNGIHGSYIRTANWAYDSVIFLGNSTTQVLLFDIPLGATSILFTMRSTYSSTVRVLLTFMLTDIDIVIPISVYQSGVSTFSLYVVVSNRQVFIKSVATGNNADRLHFFETEFKLLTAF